jgi:enoyl-CoA hydratase
MSATSSFELPDAPVLTSTEEGVRTLTLNRPKARNAMSSELIRQLREALAEADRDDSVRVVVLTGSDPAFCAGLDLKELGETGANLDLAEIPGQPYGTPWAPLGKPVIGAINGVAVTGGLELALHCDLLVASDRAAFADTHGRVGVFPRWGLTARLAKAVGARLARHMSLTGEYLGAEAAHTAGLVSAVVSHDELSSYVAGMAQRIAAGDQEVISALLLTYRGIEAVADDPALAVEQGFAEQWSDDPRRVAARRDQVFAHGRSAVKPIASSAGTPA